MILEEEAKRLQQKSNEFQYNYDVPQKTEIITEGPQMQEECSTVEEKPFVPPPQLDVPVDIAIVSLFLFLHCQVRFNDLSVGFLLILQPQF